MSASHGKIVSVVLGGTALQAMTTGILLSQTADGSVVAGIASALIVGGCSLAAAIWANNSQTIDIERVVGWLNRKEDQIGQTLQGNFSGPTAELIEAVNHREKQVHQSFERISDGLDRVTVLSRELMSQSGNQTQGQMQQQQTQRILSSISQLSDTVQGVSQSAAQAAQAARQANKDASEGQEVVNHVTSSINSLAAEVQRAASAIQKLEKDSESIGAILEVIRGIADQTNLLALNAAIEAARAGEQGRGFAVVADEVRTLAQRTQEATQEINDMIVRLQEGSSNAVKVMAEGSKQAERSVSQASKAGSSLQAIADAIRSISEMNDHIASAVEEQSTYSGEIGQNLSAMTNQIADRAQSEQNLRRLSEELRAAFRDLEAEVKKVA
ncbi:MAG: methyl-accepting chemotaxis protein [Pseudomonadota bacterium]